MDWAQSLWRGSGQGKHRMWPELHGHWLPEFTVRRGGIGDNHAELSKEAPPFQIKSRHGHFTRSPPRPPKDPAAACVHVPQAITEFQ